MYNIRDYANWRGDRSISEEPFNIVDNIVFCYLSYVNLQSVWKNEPAAVREIIGPLLANDTLKTEIIEDGTDHKGYLTDIIASRRYGEVILEEYVDEFDVEDALQYSVSLFDLGTGEKVVAYRGTDDSIPGWKEDFMISYTKTRAQQRSIDFLKESLAKYPEAKFYVTGHSKGGNLALYASAHLTDEELDRVIHIYSNDGPGFCKDVLDPSKLERIDRKATRISPYFAVIGKLFEPVQLHDSRIVKSSAQLMLQHNVPGWAVTPEGTLDETDTTDNMSQWINDALEQWVESVTVEERENFVDELFAALISGGRVRFEEILAAGPLQFEKIMIQVMQTSNKSKAMTLKLPVVALYGKEGEEAVDKIAELKKSITPKKMDIIVMCIGILLLIMPEGFIGASIVPALLLITLAEVYLTVRRLKLKSWKFREEKTRIKLSVVLIALTLFIWFKPNATFVFGSFVFGVVFLIAAFQLITEMSETEPGSFYRKLCIFEAVCSVIFGVTLLYSPNSSLRWYSISVGSILIIDSVIHFVVKK